MLDRDALADLGKAEVLAVLGEGRAVARRVAADELVAAAHLADLYDAPSMVGLPSMLPVVAERLVTLGGDGTPQVSEFAATELGHHLACGPDAATALLADALDLRHRLPRLWQRLLADEVDAWRARVVAQETRPLGLEAVEWVDARLGETRRSITGIVGQLIADALRRFDPETFARREAERLDGRGVFVERPGPGGPGTTTRVAMVLDAPDAAVLDDTLDDTLDDLATIHAALGDESPLQVRRAKAVGTLTDPQLAMDLLGGDLLTHATTTQAGSTTATRPGGVRARGTRGRSAVVYLHLDACDVSNLVSDGVDGGGSIERLGPATLDLLAEWLGRPGGIARDGITVRPVLEMSRADAVDGRTPPEWMREQVVLRDRTCVFSDCTRDARSADLDHIEPYDEHGPPGQTSPENLAALCRRHHRLKTWTGWTYRRDGWDADGRPLYEWLDRSGSPALPRHLLEPAES